MADEFITFKADFKPVEEALKQTSLNIITIQKKMMRDVGRRSAKMVNQVLRATTHGNGLIAGRYEAKLTYTYHVSKDATKMSVYPQKIEPGRKNDLTIPVVSSLNYGKKIEAKYRKYLTFTVNGNFVRVKNVQIQAKNFMNSGEQYISSGAFQTDAQAILNKELKKYWG